MGGKKVKKMTPKVKVDEPKHISKLWDDMADKGIAWYEVLGETQELQVSGGDKVDPSIAKVKLMRARDLLSEEAKNYEAKKLGKMSSDDKYLQTMIKSGTLADRIAAMTLTIQASPLHNLHRITNLVAMAKKKARRESQLALESLKDLFVNNLLPDRKLIPFFTRPLLDTAATDQVLVLWYLEQCIRMAYGELITALDQGLGDSIQNYKRACINIAYDLLAEKPENEAQLLAMLVNKLGDPERKITALVMTLLQNLLHSNPAMKNVVTSDVERLLTRSNASERAKYNAVLFLNQIFLSKTEEDAELAGRLINLYFGLFAKTVRFKDKKTTAIQEGMGRKMLSALLTGVNRAFPYAKYTMEDFSTNMNDVFRVVHQSTFSTSIQALMLLFQVMNATNSVSDRFYNALYGKLLDPSVQETSKHTLLLNLLYKALKADVSPTRSQAMIKRLLQIAACMPPSFICAVLFLVSEVVSVKPALRSIFEQPQDLVAPPVEQEDQDADTEDDADLKAERERVANVLGSVLPQEEEAPVVKTHVQVTTYDPLKRNPLFAGAEGTCAWEMSWYTKHYHPSVQSFAKQLLGGRIEYGGDPLLDFSFKAFLEKHVNKKPKQKDAPVHGRHGKGNREHDLTALVRRIYSKKFLHKDHEQVDGADLYFHQFFKEKARRSKHTPAPVEEDDDIDAFADKLAMELMNEENYEDDQVPDLGDLSDVPEEKADSTDGEEDEDDFGMLEECSEAEDEEDDDQEEEAEAAEEEEEEAKAAIKRKSPFSDADDYMSMILESKKAKQ